MTYDDRLTISLSQEIYEEFVEASGKFPMFASEHEGYAIILEEMDELWEKIKLNQKTSGRLQDCHKECIQVGAMALRFLHDMHIRHPMQDLSHVK